MEPEPPPKQTEAKQGSCPDVRRHLSAGFTNDQASYRPNVRELPDDFFKGFPHGRLAVFTEEKKQQIPLPVMPNPDMTRLHRPSLPIIGPGPVPAFHNEPLIRGPRLTRPFSDTITKHQPYIAPRSRPRYPAMKRGGSGSFTAKKKEDRRTNSDPDKEAQQVPMPQVDYPQEWPPGMLVKPPKRKGLRGEESKESTNP